MIFYSIEHNVVIGWLRMAIYARDTTDPEIRLKVLNDMIRDFEGMIEKPKPNPVKEPEIMEDALVEENPIKPGFWGSIRRWLE